MSPGPTGRDRQRRCLPPSCQLQVSRPASTPPRTSTGLAFKWFADQDVDVAVIEVGLGGRLDSTNIITPDLSVVTSIALDHCALLGNTLGEIAREKAGIFKKGVPALAGEYLPETRPVFEEVAGEVGASLTFAQDAEPSLQRLSGEILERMDLRGKYQSKNLRTVLSAIDILKRDPYYSNLYDEEKVADAIIHTAHLSGFHGRWERLSEDPVIIADIGHNPAALKENFAQLDEIITAVKETLEVTLPELAADILDRGIYLTGGGAKLRGIKTKFEKEILIPITIPAHPENCVALGTAARLRKGK